MEYLTRIVTYVYRPFVIATLVLLAYSNHKLQVQLTQVSTEVNRIHSIDLMVDSVKARLDTMELIHPWKTFKPSTTSKTKKTSLVCDGTFLGFILYTPVDTSLCEEFKLALSHYDGPQVKINSLKRRGSRSKHCKGRAADLELSSQLVEYLTSDHGQLWLNAHGLTFMIEGKPGSRRVSKYYNTPHRSYVYFNPNATGDHVHIEKV